MDEEQYDVDNEEQPVEVIVIDRPTFDPDYACHLPGIARLVQAMSSFGAFICVVFSHYGWYGVYISSTVTIICFTASMTLFLMHLFHTVELTADSVDWYHLELIYSAMMSLLIAMSTGFVLYGAIRWRSVAMTWGIATGFLIIALIFLIISTYKVFREKNPKKYAPTTTTEDYENATPYEKSAAYDYSAKKSTPENVEPDESSKAVASIVEGNQIPEVVFTDEEKKQVPNPEVENKTLHIHTEVAESKVEKTLPPAVPNENVQKIELTTANIDQVPIIQQENKTTSIAENKKSHKTRHERDSKPEKRAKPLETDIVESPSSYSPKAADGEQHTLTDANRDKSISNRPHAIETTL